TVESTGRVAVRGCRAVTTGPGVTAAAGAAGGGGCLRERCRAAERAAGAGGLTGYRGTGDVPASAGGGGSRTGVPCLGRRGCAELQRIVRIGGAGGTGLWNSRGGG